MCKPLTIYTGVKITSLPKQYQTEEFRKFYDKDNNGWLDKSNDKGQNEIKLAEAGLGIKLDKYITTEAVDYRSSESGDCAVAQGPKGKAVHHNHRDNIWSKDPNETTVKDTLFSTSGKPVVTSYYHFTPEKNSDYSYGYVEVHESKQVTKGENNIIRYRDKKYYGAPFMKFDFKDYVADGTLPRKVKEAIKEGKITDLYKLNGQTVAAKPIGKGRYEVTDSEGNVSYISHDGKKLDPEYVRTH